MRKGKELKAPRYASAAATRDGNLPSRDGNLPHSRQSINEKLKLEKGKEKNSSVV
jgi:hypothetical protein